MSLCLADFADDDKKYDICNTFILNPHSRLDSIRSKPSGKMQGYCSERKLGLFQKTHCVICVYIEELVLKMALMGNIYNLSDDDVKAHVTTIFPLAKQFTLLHKDKLVLSFKYWFFEPKDCWPECDIFPFIELITRSSNSKRRIVLILNEAAEGRDITRSEFLARLEKENS